MKYKLKEGKTLTKEDLINTKWKVPNLNAAYSLLNEAIMNCEHPKVENGIGNMFQQIFFYNIGDYAECYYNPFATESELQENFNKYENHKEMNFNDWFKEDNPKSLTKGMQEKLRKDSTFLNNKEYEKVKRIEGVKNIKIKEGSFVWAVEQMKLGKKVRRKQWDKLMSPSIYLSEGGFWHERDKAEFRQSFFIDDFEATDWEIYKEKLKTINELKQ